MEILELTKEEYEKRYGSPPPDIGPTPIDKKEVATRQEQTTRPIANQVTDFMGFKGATDLLGATIARTAAPEREKPYVQYPTGQEALGSGLQGLAWLVPGAGAKNIATRVASGATAGYMFDVGSKIQHGQPNTFSPGVGTAVGAVFPGFGVAAGVVGKLFKGMGVGLSGASSETIRTIIQNPVSAMNASRLLAEKGNAKILEQNAKTIVDGIVSARRQARQIFGNALEGLAKEDIQPAIFRSATQEFLDRYGVSLESGSGTRVFDNIEFDDPKNIQKASDLIDRLANTELDGRSLRKLMDDIDASKFKTATSDERLSFNAFLRDMEESIRGAVNKSTPKLIEMNAAFSKDMQLIEAAETIFGSVDYANMKEVLRASERLEGLFNQKGLRPEFVRSFLERIGISPDEFATSEAVRQISTKEGGANAMGVSFGEMTRAITGAIVSPQMVKNLSIATGVAEKLIEPFLRALPDASRSAVIRALLLPGEQNSQTPQ